MPSKYKFLAFSAAALWTLQAHALDTTTRNGNVLTVGLPVLAAGLAWGNHDVAGLTQLVKSEATTVVLSEVLKNSTHQTRPNGKDDQSFPSRHTAVAFSAAQFMHMKGGWAYGAPAYLAASYVAHSRVDAHEHRWRDVAAGAALGVLTTYTLTDDTQSRWVGLSYTGRSASLQLVQAFK